MSTATATVLDLPSINNPASVVDPRVDEPLVVDWTVDIVVDNDIGGQKFHQNLKFFLFCFLITLILSKPFVSVPYLR